MTIVKTQAWYVAGPMTGLPQFNFPAFDAASADLRERGYDVVSPAELDDEDTRAAALASPDGAPGTGSSNGETWGDYLARDLKLVADVVDGIAVLPGWDKSSGARTETFMAHVCRKPITIYPTLHPTDRFLLAKAWLGPELWDEVVRRIRDGEE